MIPIIVTSVALVMVFVVLLITAIVLFVNLAKKKDNKKKRDLLLVISAGILFFALVGVDAYLVTSHFEYNKEKTKEIALDAAETTGEGFVATFDAAKKKWDEKTIEKLANIDVSISDWSESTTEGEKTYVVTAIFNNKNTSTQTIGVDQMVSLNYLMFTDENQIVYAVDDESSETDFLPSGKSEITLTAYVDSDVVLTDLRFGDQTIPLK